MLTDRGYTTECYLMVKRFLVLYFDKDDDQDDDEGGVDGGEGGVTGGDDACPHRAAASPQHPVFLVPVVVQHKRKNSSFAFFQSRKLRVRVQTKSQMKLNQRGSTMDCFQSSWRADEKASFAASSEQPKWKASDARSA